MNNNEQIGKQDTNQKLMKLSKKQVAIIGEALLDMSQMQEKLHYLNVQLLQNVGTASLTPELKQLFVSLLTDAEEEARQLQKFLAPQDNSKPGEMVKFNHLVPQDKLKELWNEHVALENSQTEVYCTSQQEDTTSTANRHTSSETTISDMSGKIIANKSKSILDQMNLEIPMNWTTEEDKKTCKNCNEYHVDKDLYPCVGCKDHSSWHEKNILGQLLDIDLKEDSNDSRSDT